MAHDIAISSGNAALDSYLEHDYEVVRGMSSRFAAAISGHLIRFQSAQGITGDLAEIGAFKGRFFIAMMKGIQPGEKGLAIDVFDWPNERCLDDFLANCARHGVNRDSMIVWKTDTRGMTAEMLSAKLGGQKVRFFHIDGDHSDECLSKDLELATAVLHEKGLLCLDDILHPGYPTLVLTVMRYLERHPEMVVHAIIDREDIVAAPKFLIGRRETVDLYVTELMRAYPQFIFVMGADFVSYGALVLTPKPRLAEVD